MLSPLVTGTFVRSLPALLLAWAFALGSCSDCTKPPALSTEKSPVAEPAPAERRLLCTDALPGAQAARPPAGFTGAVPTERTDSALRAAQWLFSMGSGAGLARAPDTIEAKSLLKALGRSLESSRFELFEASFGSGTFGTQRYGLVSKDLRQARLMEHCEDFNALVASLDRGPRSKPDTIGMARAYLVMIGSLIPADVIIDRGGGASPEELQALQAWFAQRPGLKLGDPVFDRAERLARMRFWTWRRTDGLLRRHSIEMDPSGRVIQHVEEVFGKRIGKMVKV
jgi:hypothetical protein